MYHYPILRVQGDMRPKCRLVPGGQPYYMTIGGKMNNSKKDETFEAIHSEQSSKKPHGSFFLILFLTMFALGFGALGFGMMHSGYKKEQSYNGTAEGRIIDYRKSSHKNKRMFSPIVEYQVGDEVFIGETNASLNYRPYKEGAYVEVHYNPKNPDEFYIKEFDLETTYKLGRIFLFVSIGILIILVLCFVLSKLKMNKEKKERILAKVVFSAALLFIFIVSFCLAGLIKTLCIFAGMGLFALYGIHQNKKKK